MPPTTVPENDKDYILLNEIDSRSDLSQRELSERTGLSLGSVNLLLQNMIREGLVKMELIPAHRVAYMLTPKGLTEKAKKAVRYISRHYHAIQNTKESIWRKLDLYSKNYDSIVICEPQGQLKDLVAAAIEEYRHKNPKSQILMLDKNTIERQSLRHSIILYLPEEGQKPSIEADFASCETDSLI